MGGSRENNLEALITVETLKALKKITDVAMCYGKKIKKQKKHNSLPC